MRSRVSRSQVLETLGAYRTDAFPAFSSGLAAPHRFDDAHEVAAASDAARAPGIDAGLLLAVPHPSPADGDVIEAADADPAIDGARVTPFVLGRVNALTDGAAVRSNVALVENNARVGADVAVALAEIAQERSAT